MVDSELCYVEEKKNVGTMRNWIAIEDPNFTLCIYYPSPSRTFVLGMSRATYPSPHTLLFD